MTKPMSAEIAGKEIRYELSKLPGRIVYGVGARERLREMCHLSESQFAKGLAYNLAVWDDIFIVVNERRNGSIYMLTSNADLAWLPVADSGHYIHARTKSLSKLISVVEEALMKQDAPVAVRSAWYAVRRSIEDAASALAPAVRQSALMAGLPEKKIERWMRA